MRLHVSIVIAAPPARVWDEIEPVERHVEWMRDARRITFTSGRTRGVGTEFDCLTAVGPFRLHDQMRVVEWDPPRTMGIEHAGAIRGQGRFLLAPAGDGHTRFEWSERLRFPWWLAGPFGARLARPLLARLWRANLQRLRDACEDA